MRCKLSESKEERKKTKLYNEEHNSRWSIAYLKR